jgi:hypothetical protein
MRLKSAYLTASLAAASAVLCFAVALAIPAVLPQPKIAAPALSDPANIVNRTLKGDRLRVIVRPPETEPFEVQGPRTPTPKLLDGCESGFSPMDQSAAAKRPQRCTT